MAMYRIRTVFTGPQGSPWLATQFLAATGGTAQQAATAVGTFWGACDALMATAVTWRQEEDVAQINSATGELLGVEAITGSTGTGALSTELGPFVSQGLIRWRTNTIINGRSLKGRSFVPGLTVSSQDDGRVIAASQTVLTNAATGLVFDANSALVVWHRPSSAGAGDGAEGLVTSGVCWTQFASLRSRRD